MTRPLIICLALLFPALCACQPSSTTGTVTNLEYRLVETRPHPQRPFTQGLEMDSGDWLESSGRYGHSYLMRYRFDEQAQAQILWQTPLADHFFAEGLTRLGDSLYLLTWKRGTLHIFHSDTGELQNTLHYPGEGWGLTNDGQWLIRSDGSDRLYFHHPDTFALERSIQVTAEGEAVTRLNELEFAGGLIWTNVWQQNRLLGIDPLTGAVRYQVDIGDLARGEAHRNPDWVANGIAWDEERQGFWISGKRWHQLYLLQWSLPPATPISQRHEEESHD